MQTRIVRSIWMLAVLGALGCGGSSRPEPDAVRSADPPELRPEVGEIIDRGAWRRLWIVTGGQSGTDRAAMDVALSLGLPLRGWCPKDRWSETGRIEDQYPLQETGSRDPAVRTEMNVLDSDGTLVLNLGVANDGTPLTEQLTEKHRRPLLSFEIEGSPSEDDVRRFRRWIEESSIRILNVAGPRESHRPGAVYERSRVWLEALLKKV